MYIVTGASSGIGHATALALIQRGCHVTVTARRLDRLQQLVELAPDRVHAVRSDLGTSHGIAAVVEAVNDRQNIAGLVHAGGTPIVPTAYAALDPDALVSDMAVHVGAPVALNRALHRQLAGGRVLYIDSYSASTLREGWSGYSIVKAAAQMAARAAAAELTGVRVVRVFPGGVRTELVEGVLASTELSPAVESFRTLDEQGELVTPKVIGAFISQVLLDATDTYLAEHETLDFTNPADQTLS